MYVVYSMWYLGQSFAKLITVSTYIDIFPWELDTTILGYMHDLSRSGVKGHLGVIDLWLKFFEKNVTVSTHFDVFPWELDTIILG